jgi:glycosyltransferase involved in cell wall biosynthesis
LLGATSHAVAWQKSVFGYDADEIIWPAEVGLARQELDRWRLLFKAIREFDVIHYNYGSPILNWGALDGRHKYIAAGLGGVYAYVNQGIELPLIHHLGRVIAVTYQGDDARQGAYSKNNFEISIANEVAENYYPTVSDETKKDRISRFGKYADLIYALNPDLLHVLPGRAKFLPYAHIDLDLWTIVDGSSNSRPLIIHAPSNREAKGTRFLMDAIRKLKEEGLDFDFQLVEGLTQAEARLLYEKADLVVDQLLAGWYGGFAVEAMALGKPVISYIRHDDLKFIPLEMRKDLPLIEANPHSIESVLRKWISKPAYKLRQQGLISRKYVEEWHNPIKIAQVLLNDYQTALLARQ